MWNDRIAAAALLLLLFAVPGGAADQEGCLFCHRLGIASHGSPVSDLRVTERAGSLHGALYCSDCHPDARMAPHAVPPGPARCIEACHAEGAGTVPESHRRAAFGGMTESHRPIAMPASPCLVCHRSDDPPSSSSPAAARCKACHPGESLSLSEGVHARLRLPGAGSGCTACHLPHPAAVAGARAESSVTCRKTGCHDVVTDRMKALGAHGKGAPSERPGRVPAALLFGSLPLLALVAGRFLCASRETGKGGKP